MERISTVAIVKDLVENWVIKLNVKSVVNNGSTYTLNTCNTSYLTVGTKLTINAVVYNITDIVNNESLTVTGASLPIKGIYTINAPFFTHGTVKQANEELSLQSDMFQKTPMIFLRRTFREVFDNSNKSYDRISDLTLYFLTQADFQSWQIDAFDKQAINPMRNLAYDFIEMLNENKQISATQLNDFTIEDKIKFGVFVNDKGYESAIFNDTLSGVELNISIPIKKNYKCNC